MEQFVREILEDGRSACGHETERRDNVTPDMLEERRRHLLRKHCVANDELGTI